MRTVAQMVRLLVLLGMVVDGNVSIRRARWTPVSFVSVRSLSLKRVCSRLSMTFAQAEDALDQDTGASTASRCELSLFLALFATPF